MAAPECIELVQARGSVAFATPGDEQTEFGGGGRRSGRSDDDDDDEARKHLHVTAIWVDL